MPDRGGVDHMAFLSGRKLEPEQMDDPAVDRDQLARSLSFIRMVNRRLGGGGAALRCLGRWSAQWPRGQVIRIIDIGTGSADIPLAIVRWAEPAGRPVRIVAVDRHRTTLELAREFLGGADGIELVEADATRLMDLYSPGAFDYAHAGMFLHHLPDVEVMTVLRIMDRLTRRGLIWNDLIRGVVGRIGVRLLTLGAPPIVRHDAQVSVNAGFTRREALELAGRVGLANVEYRTHWGHRFTVVSTK